MPGDRRGVLGIACDRLPDNRVPPVVEMVDGEGKDMSVRVVIQQAMGCRIRGSIVRRSRYGVMPVKRESVVPCT